MSVLFNETAKGREGPQRPFSAFLTFCGKFKISTNQCLPCLKGGGFCEAKDGGI